MKQLAASDERSGVQAVDDQEFGGSSQRRSRKRDRLKYLFWVNVKLAKI